MKAFDWSLTFSQAIIQVSLKCNEVLGVNSVFIFICLNETVLNYFVGFCLSFLAFMATNHSQILGEFLIL